MIDILYDMFRGGLFVKDDFVLIENTIACLRSVSVSMDRWNPTGGRRRMDSVVPH